MDYQQGAAGVGFTSDKAINYALERDGAPISSAALVSMRGSFPDVFHAAGGQSLPCCAVFVGQAPAAWTSPLGLFVINPGDGSGPSLAWLSNLPDGNGILAGPIVPLTSGSPSAFPASPPPDDSGSQQGRQTSYDQGYSDGRGHETNASRRLNDQEIYNAGFVDGWYSYPHRVVPAFTSGNQGPMTTTQGMSPSYPPGTWPPPEGAVINDATTGGGSPGVVGGQPGIPVSWVVTGGYRREIADQGALTQLGLTAPNWSATNLVVTTAQLDSLPLGPPLYGATMTSPQGPPAGDDHTNLIHDLEAGAGGFVGGYLLSRWVGSKNSSQAGTPGSPPPPPAPGSYGAPPPPAAPPAPPVVAPPPAPPLPILPPPPPPKKGLSTGAWAAILGGGAALTTLLVVLALRARRPVAPPPTPQLQPTPAPRV